MSVAVERDSKHAQPPAWLRERERGSSLGIRFFVAAVSVLGRAVTRAFLWPVVLYYVATHPSARRASREWLERVGARARLWDVYRHLPRFAECALDRMLLAQGRTRAFDVTLTGHEHLRALADERRGAILLGAHLGSFEAMRAQSEVKGIDIHVVVNSENARMVAAAIARLGPQGASKIVEVGRGGGLDAMLRVREIVDGGSLVAILGDRLDPDGRVVEAPFFGQVARFPAGPYLLASALGCPVYLTFGLYRGGNRYDLFCEPFAERLTLARGRRDAALAEHAARYAARLEHYARLEPDNWFNFFDFWGRE